MLCLHPTKKKRGSSFGTLNQGYAGNCLKTSSATGKAEWGRVKPRFVGLLISMVKIFPSWRISNYPHDVTECRIRKRCTVLLKSVPRVAIC